MLPRLNTCLKFLSLSSKLAPLCCPDVPNPAESSIATWLGTNFKVNYRCFYSGNLYVDGHVGGRPGRWKQRRAVGWAFLWVCMKRTQTYKSPGEQAGRSHGLSLSRVPVISGFEQREGFYQAQEDSVFLALDWFPKACCRRETLALPLLTWPCVREQGLAARSEATSKAAGARINLETSWDPEVSLGCLKAALNCFLIKEVEVKVHVSGTLSLSRNLFFISF